MDCHEAYLGFGSRAHMSKFRFGNMHLGPAIRHDPSQKASPQTPLNILFTLNYLAMVFALWTLLQCWRYFPGYLDSISLRPPELSLGLGCQQS